MEKRINQLASTQWPSCKCNMEKPNHMFQCPEDSRMAITLSCLDDIRAICKKRKLHIMVENEIMTALKAWIEFPEIEPTFDQIRDPESRAALQAQSAIGWDKFFKGFIAQPLQQLINDQRNNPLNAFEKVRWTTEILTTIWEHQLQHWKQRNTADHGSTPAETGKIKRARAKELYDLKYLIPLADRAMFSSWKRTRLKTIANLGIWIKTVRRTVDYILDTSKLADNDPDPNPNN